MVGGDTIGRYIVLRRLGAGGMGVVYAAYDPQLDRKVALKLLRTGTGLGEAQARARLVREAQAIAQLSHPNVVAVYDVGTAASDEVYVAMEFVEGDTLTQWLTRWPRTWREVIEIFREAGRGLAAAHARGLLHRDFKPDNVLVGADGRVRVTDFGLARSLVTGPHEDSFVGMGPHIAALRVTLTATGAVMGTPRYMAPEQLAGGDVGAAGDQFSFCVALYEALFGCHPIAGDTAAKMLDEGARAQSPPDDKDVPAWIAPILLRGLDPVPARRFPSMSALVDELAPPAPSRSRRRYVAVLGAAALVLGGAAAATVIAPKGGGGADIQDKFDRLESEFQELVDERNDLLRVLSDLQQRGDTDQRRINQLITQLADKTQRIEELEVQLRTIAGDAGVVATAKPSPPRPPRPEGGIAIGPLKKTLATIQPRVAGCMEEWVDRKRALAALPQFAGVTVTMRIFPEGRVQRTSAEGLDDKIVPECVEEALRDTTWPTSPDLTVAKVNVRQVEGQISVTVERLGSEPAPPRSDIGGE